MSDAPPPAGEIIRVATRLWGEPNRQQSNGHEMRFGTNGSKSLDVDKRTWFDHEAGEGGGWTDLYKLAHEPFPHGRDNNGTANAPLGGRNGAATGHEPNRAPRVVATYEYRDETDALRFQVCRLAPKSFRQRRPDGNGGWIWDMRGVERLPYRLPDLLRAPPTTARYITEGEKDADALAERMLVATTNPGGAGKWDAGFARYFERTDCIILPDNDDAGAAHALAVARSLSGVARTVRIVRLPGLAHKGDVSDWLANGGTVEDLEQLAATTPEWRDEIVQVWGVWDASSIVPASIPPRGWLLGTSFCRRFLSSLVADGGVGKSSLRIAQAISIASGQEISGEHVFVRPCRVLIVSLEDDRSELERRVAAAMIHHNIKPDDLQDRLFLACPRGMKLLEMKDREVAAGALKGWLDDVIEHYKPDLAILDPFVKVHGLGENDNAMMDLVCDHLATLADQQDMAVDIPHHTRKGGANTPGNADQGRGASAIKDATRITDTLTPMTSDEAAEFGLNANEQSSFVRFDSGKHNLCPARQATWFRLVSVPIGNPSQTYPAGDHVQTVEIWTPPEIWAGTSSPVLNRILDDIDAGLPNGSRYSSGPTANERAAWRVVVHHYPDKNEEQAREIIRTWLRTGLLFLDTYDDTAARKRLKGLRVNPTKRPS